MYTQSISLPIREAIARILSGEPGSSHPEDPLPTSRQNKPRGADNPARASLLQFQPIGGGSINRSFRVSDPMGGAGSGTQNPGPGWFCKSNSASLFPGMFEKEARGLALLAERVSRSVSPLLHIPRVIGHAMEGDGQVLVMEWIPEGTPTRESWRIFGEGLAFLHRSGQGQQDAGP